MTSIQNPLFAVAAENFSKTDAATSEGAICAEVDEGGSTGSAPSRRQRGCGSTVAIILTSTGLIGSLVALGIGAVMWTSGDNG